MVNLSDFFMLFNLKILNWWHNFQDPCWQAWTNKLCWWTEASVTGCTANGVYWKFKTNRFCYNWVHTALIYQFFLLEKSLKLPLEQNAWSVVCPWSIFLWKIIFLHVKKIQSFLQNTYLNSIGSIFMCHIAKFQVVQV